MTGKITKVLNMKPPEILSLIEEAAGTSMFEEKKDRAVTTMAKKEKKMEEIQDVRLNVLTPDLVPPHPTSFLFSSSTAKSRQNSNVS